MVEVLCVAIADVANAMANGPIANVIGVDVATYFYAT